jgi:hypothetical protein
MWRRFRLVVLLAAMIAATWVLGWWGIGVVGAIWGWFGRPRDAAMAAVLAWSAALAYQGVGAPLLPLAERVGALVGVSGWLALALPALFAGVLAWGTATVAASLADLMASARRAL